MNDPVKNLSALSRSGIQFFEEQKKVINILVATGRLAEAQAVILDEPERQYGGRPEAAAKVGIGPLQQLKNSWGDFLEQIGTQLIEFGLMIVAFQSALKSVLANPWVAIGVGAAMVAAAAVMTALINKNAQKNVPKLAQGGMAYGPTYAMVGDNHGARVDPEVIAPLSRLRSMMTSGGTQNIAITLGGQLTAKGRDMVYVLAKENFKIDLLGG